MADLLPDWLITQAKLFMVGIATPIHAFVAEGGARFFWFYCITGLIIAAVVYARVSGRGAFSKALFDKNTWLSDSAINDYILAALVPALRLTLFSVLALNWRAVSDFVVFALQSVGVAGEVTDSTAVFIGLALTVTLFLVDDFLRWWTHYIFHRIPELWEFHKVHHSAEVLNFATAERHHPVEVVMTSAVIAVGYGLVNGLYIALFGDKLTVWTVAGANIFLFAFNICGGVLRHSPFWISFGPRAERWFISPAMHHIHHSAKEEHFDRNMGGALAIWDRWAGTLHIPKGREVEDFGIGAETRDFRSMEVILVRPVVMALRLLGRRTGLSIPPLDQASRPASDTASLKD